MSKKWWIALAGVFILAVAVLAVPFFVNVNVYRELIQTRMSKAINRDVSLNDLRLSLFPVAMESKDVRISDDPTFRRDDFVRIQNLRLHINLWSLLQRRVEVTSLELIAPNVWLVKNSRGVWNFSTLGSAPSLSIPITAAGFAAATPSSNFDSFDISNLTLKNGRIVIVDQAHPSEGNSYDILEFKAHNISARAAIPFSLTATATDRKEPIVIEGEAGPLDPKNLADSPCKGTIEAKTLHFGKLSLQKVKGQFNLAQQVLKFEPVDFDFYSGHQNGTLSINLLKPTPALFLNSHLTKVDANDFLSHTSSVKNLFFGLVGGNLSLNTSGEKRSNVFTDLRGRASLDLQKGKLAHLSIGREVLTVAKLAGVNFPEGETPITKMSGNFDIADNWARSNDLQIATPDLDLMCQGGFSFDNELKFNVMATFSKEASQKMQSQSPVGGLLNALLADKNKEVSIPFQVTGTLQKPHFKLDSQRLLSMKSGQITNPSNLQNAIQSIQDLFKKKN